MTQNKSYGIIYKAINIVNGKAYIGQTTTGLEKRKRSHISRALNKKDNIYFHSALRKHGIKSFDWEIIHECDTIQELNKLETYYIKKYGTFGKKGYNLNAGGGNKQVSVETRRKLSEASKGRKHSEETKRKISKTNGGKNNPFFGKKHSGEAKQKMSIARKGEKNHMFGKHCSEEVKRKISKSLSGKNHPMYGKNLSEETKRKIAESQIGEKNHRFGIKISDEHKQKLFEANQVQIIIGNKHFSSRKRAAKFIGVVPPTIRQRILHKTKWLDYSYAK